METFDEKMHALPQELYDEIYDLIFVPRHEHVYINKCYRPPAILQVSQATRQMLAKRYYGKDIVFHVPHYLAKKWLKSVEAVVGASSGIQSEIRVTENPFETKDLTVWRLYTAFYGELSDIICQSCCVALQADAMRCMKFEVVFGQPEKRVWMGVPDLYEDPDDEPIDDEASAAEFCERKFGG